MFEKLQLLNSDKNLRQTISRDFSTTLLSIGFAKDKAVIIVEKFFDLLSQSDSTNVLEKTFREFIFNQKIEASSFKDAFGKLEISRAERIYSEIVEFISFDEKVLDYGCGNALVAQLLTDKNKLNVTGCDVVVYNKKETLIPIIKIDNYHVDTPDDSFTIGYANSVIHHDLNPEKVIAEISRIVSNKFILIEDTLQGNDATEIKSHSCRLFINDYFYNRLLNDSDIPVPGEYMKSLEWINLFSIYGWKLIKQDQLGWSKILPAVFRERFIFERK